MKCAGVVLIGDKICFRYVCECGHTELAEDYN